MFVCGEFECKLLSRVGVALHVCCMCCAAALHVCEWPVCCMTSVCVVSCLLYVGCVVCTVVMYPSVCVVLCVVWFVWFHCFMSCCVGCGYVILTVYCVCLICVVLSGFFCEVCCFSLLTCGSEGFVVFVL